MSLKLSSLGYYLSAFICGGLLPLAFAPVYLYGLSIICPAVLLGLWLKASPRQAAWLGFVFGLGFFGVGISWVINSIYLYGNTNLFIAILITALFVATLALFFAIPGYLLQKCFGHRAIPKVLLVFPSLWALFEWIRSWILSGFPWLLLGHSAVSSPLAGMAPIVGVYGLSFLLTLASGLLLIASLPQLSCGTTNKLSWQKSNIAGFSLLLLIALCYSSNQLHWGSDHGAPLRTSLVQGNIPQNMRWDPTQVSNILERYQDLSAGLWSSRLIVWPEAAIPLTPTQGSVFYHNLDQRALSHQSTVLFGLPIEQHNTYYNGVMTLGANQGVYTKRHLVPFGEYVPFENQLRGLIGFFNLPMSSFLAGKLVQPLLQVEHIPIGSFICYEVAYNTLLRQDVPQAELLVTVSDDDWFGRSLAPWQHLQIAQFQAAASARPMIFASNSGSSAFIDAQGQIEVSLPLFIAGSIMHTVQPKTGSTPWVWLGDTPFLLFDALLLCLAYYLGHRPLAKHK